MKNNVGELPAVQYKRYEMLKSSPFESVHEGMGAVFGEFDGWKMPANYGDITAENAALQENCTVFDLCSFGRIMIKGAGSTELISGICTSETVDMADGKWTWEIICDGDGKPVDKVRICQVGDIYTILTTAAKRCEIYELAEAYGCKNGLGSVDIDDITEKTGMMGLYGPKAFESVAGILPIDISGLEKGEIAKKSFFMIPLTVIRGSWTGSDGIELICPVSAAGLAAGAIAKYRDKANITPSGMECLANAMASSEL
jgi:aminomethyltransferase